MITSKKSASWLSLFAVAAALTTLALLAAPIVDPASNRGEGESTVTVDELLRTATTTSGHPVYVFGEQLKIVASRYRVGGRSVLPPHRHLYPRLGYMLSGSLKVTNLERNTSRLFNAGEVIVEDVGIWHEGRNLQAAPAELLVFDLVRPD